MYKIKKKNQLNNKNCDNLCKWGCFITIFVSTIISLLLFISSIIFLSTSSTSLTPSFSLVNNLKWFMSFIFFFIKENMDGLSCGILSFLFALFRILPIIFCIKLLKRKTKSNIPAGIISLIFSWGLIGGILILIGKYEDKNKIY